jgi:hypothetical protein
VGEKDAGIREVVYVPRYQGVEEMTRRKWHGEERTREEGVKRTGTRRVRRERHGGKAHAHDEEWHSCPEPTA